MSAFGHDLIWLENRRTPKVVSTGADYTPTEAEGKIKRRRAATAEEEKVIERGDWVRVNEHDDKPTDSGYKRKKSKVRPQKNTNSLVASVFADTVFAEYVLMQSSEDGYAGVTHSGIALLAESTGRVLFAQRADDPTDDPAVNQSWEFPGGGIEDGEHPWGGAVREFGEEMGFMLPEGEVVNGWRSSNGVYQGFVYLIPAEFPVDDDFLGTDEVQAATWGDRDWVAQATERGILRPEVADDTDWDMIFGSVSGNSEDSDMPDDMTDDEPEYSADAFSVGGPIPVHGVVAPEELPSGDRRAFGKGAMTRRPLAIPIRDTSADVGGHDGAFMAGRMDRMMRSGGLIHYEGSLMPGASDNLVAKMQFMDGSYGVSVDGDQGNVDNARTDETGTLWFDQIRAAGLTAVDIPAFYEAHIRFGLHPDMPTDDALVASAFDAGTLIGARSDALTASVTFGRGAGYATPAGQRIHDYWTKPGQPGYAKVGWGTAGDFARAKALIGAKIAEHSPDKMRFLNQIIAQWHFDALGYWPGDHKRMLEGKAPKASLSRTGLRMAMNDSEDDLKVDVSDDDTDNSVWEAVLVSSAVSGNRKRPPLSYFHQHPSMVEDVWAAESGALIVEEPDANGFSRTWGYAAEWGVCHVGMDGRCVEPPKSGSDDYPDFHLGRTKTEEGYLYTGVLTCGVGHRDADTLLSESPEQAMFDNIKNAWAAVRVGENERGIWFSGVVLPKVDDDLLVKIEASGQVSGEWLAGEMRACLTVNVPGFPNQRPSAAYDENGNVLALAASAFGQRKSDSPCSGGDEDDPVGDLAMAVWARIDAKQRMDRIEADEAAARFAALQTEWEN